MLLVLLLSCTSTSQPLTLHWAKNILTISGPQVPGQRIDVWYLEAYCRSGSTDRDWRETVIPHRTTPVSASPRQLRLHCEVGPSVSVDHDITAGTDEVTFRLTATNRGAKFADVQWAQPCLRVDRFTGLGQEDYFRRCFVFTDRGLTLLHHTRRTTKARYVPGQVYVPAGIDLADVNPRPISKDVPVNGLIGAFSADDRKILAMAWDSYQELFQGVIVCIHSDFRVGGLQPGQTKRLLGKIYLVDNDVGKLLERYRRDFAEPVSR